MTEDDYIKATNKAKLQIALTAIYDLLEGERYGVVPESYVHVHEQILKMIEYIDKSIGDLEESNGK